MKTVQNPPNPFASHDREYLEGMEPPAKLHIYEDNTKQILSQNDSPDLPFRWSLNPYRGCTHACAYCFARPTHEYLDFGAGTDFETRIVIKPKAAELLRQTFMKPSWKGEFIVFSGDTDPYQPLEASYQLTRKCLEVCLEFGNPLGLITKSFLILRDINLLQKINERTHLGVTISIPFWDEKMARVVEPGASSISQRFEIIRRLTQAGIPVSVNLAPLIPGLNDADMPRILKKAKECGAQNAAMIILRLPGSVKEVFLSRMETAFPLAYKKIESKIREARGGDLYHSDFGKRYRGEGNYWNQIESMFKVYTEKLGFNVKELAPERLPFKRPSLQKELFASESDLRNTQTFSKQTRFVQPLKTRAQYFVA